MLINSITQKAGTNGSWVQYPLLFLWLIGYLSSGFGQATSVQPHSFRATQNALHHYSKFINKAELNRHVSLLASDSLEGREFGKLGAVKASEYLGVQLRQYGLKPIGDRQTFYQPMQLQRWQWKTLTFLFNNKELIPGTDYNASISDLGLSQSFKGDHVMFVGYGIEDKEHNDYQYAQIRGEILLMLDGEPMDNGQSIITQSDERSKWSNDLRNKIEVAVRRGGQAIILLTDSTRFPKQSVSRVMNRSYYGKEMAGNYKLPVIRVNEAALSRMFTGSELRRIQRYIEQSKKGKIASNYVSTTLDLKVEASVETILDRNVVGLIEGNDPQLKDEVVVVSAHFDHIGIINGEVYNGADDNGSGTAALLNIAKAMQGYAGEGFELKRSVLFLFVTGEEKGLLGSAYYADHPIIPLEKTKININLDMIGRHDKVHTDNENYIYVIGSDKINPLLDYVLRANNNWSVNYKLDYTYNREDHPMRLYYRSDHYSFAKRGIPSVFLFGGFHDDYHKPGDDTHLIDFQKVEDIGRLVYFTIIDLANHEHPIKTQYQE